MFTKARQVQGNLTFRDRDLSPPEGQSLWEQFPGLALQSDPSVAYLYMEEFAPYRAADWTLSGSGAVAVGSLDGGSLQVRAAATTAGSGEQIQLANTLVVPQAGRTPFGKMLWYETQLQVNTLNNFIFFGLAVPDSTILTGPAGSVHPANWIGFVCNTGNGVVLLCLEQNGVLATPVPVGTLTANTLTRIGFFYDGQSTVTPYWNGVAGTPIGTALVNLPLVALAPAFVCQGNGVAGTQPILEATWLRIGALR